MKYLGKDKSPMSIVFREFESSKIAIIRATQALFEKKFKNSSRWLNHRLLWWSIFGGCHCPKVVFELSKRNAA